MNAQQQTQESNNTTSVARKNSSVIQLIAEPSIINKEQSCAECNLCLNQQIPSNKVCYTKPVKHPLNCLVLCNRWRKPKKQVLQTDLFHSSSEKNTEFQKTKDVNIRHQCSKVRNNGKLLSSKGNFLKSFPSFHHKYISKDIKHGQNHSDVSENSNELSFNFHPQTEKRSSMILASSTASSSIAVKNQIGEHCLDTSTQSLSFKSEVPIKTNSNTELQTTSSSMDAKCLRNAVEHCERRLERIYGRLIWLRNSNNILCDSPSSTPKSPKPIDTTSNQGIEAITQSHAVESIKDMTSVDKQISYLSTRMHDLKCQIEAFSFLSWIGLLQEPHTNRMPVPGVRACPPNPKLYLTRRPDSDARNTAREYQQLCEQTVTDPIRLDLRRVTFNNWPWSDAWLIRFVRQMFVDLGFVETFQLPLKRLDMWLCDIYRRYNRVPFHNYKHAFMVTQMCYALIWNAHLVEYLEKEEQMTLIISAICHDLDHPGFNNAYQINAGTELAMRYNDQSPLENHHCAMAFDILSHAEANPFEHLEPETMKRIRDGVIRCILATDMSRHNEIVNQFTTTVLSDLDYSWQIDEETKQPYWAIEKSKRDLVMMILIKVCDISNEARPLSVAGPWIDRLLAEFFHQSDYEKLVGLPAAPFMDREKVTKSASQCGFIRFVILPLFESLAKLLPPVKVLLVQPAIEQLNYYTEMQMIEEQRTMEHNNEDSKFSTSENKVEDKS